jgi:hypothetical protein
MIEAEVQPLGQMPDDWLGPQARAALLAEAAETILEATDAENAAALGGEVDEDTLVDGVAGDDDDIDKVRPEGEIVRIYDLTPVVLTQIGDWLWQHSPVRTGRYQRSHRLLAGDDVLAEVTDGWRLPATLPEGVETYTFVSVASYAPLIEPHDGKGGESRQTPDGVYQVIAALAEQAFGGLADISYATVDDEPAIIVEPL